MDSENVLYPRDAAKFIVDRSQDVKILPSGVKTASDKSALEELYARAARVTQSYIHLSNLPHVEPRSRSNYLSLLKIFCLLKSQAVVLDADRWRLHELNPKTQDDKAVDWVFITDLLNFSFWSEQSGDQSKYAVRHGSGLWTGYWSLCAALNRAADEGIAITDPKVFGSITKEQLDHILRSDIPNTSMPLIPDRLQSLHQAGQTLCEKYGGSFANAIRQCNKSASKLLRLIVDDFPTFRDVSTYDGRTVAILKRAQILVADVWACCGGRGLGEFDDIDEITAFADYRIPQSLIWLGVLEYSDSLLETLRKNEMLENGDRREVEIRGCTLWAVELMVKELKNMIKNDPEFAQRPVLPPMNSIIIDHFLWDFRREHDTEMNSIPFHKTRCIYY